MSVLFTILIWLFVHLFVLGLGVGTGLLLRLVLPMDTGQAVLIGVVTSAVSIYFFTRVMNGGEDADDFDDDDYDEDDDDEPA